MMKNLRYTWRLFVTFVTRFKGLLFLGILLGVVIFFALASFSPQLLQSSVRKIGVTGRYHTDELPIFILDEIGDGLTQLDETGTPIPDLASSWETPDQGKTWIFTLADNKYWHDGEPVTSDTISYEFSDVTVERPDDKTIVFKLEDPFSPFPTVVSRPTFQKGKGLLGTGDWEVNGNVTVVGTYVSELKLVDADKNKKIYRFYPTESQTKLAYKMGRIDHATRLFDPAPLETWDTVRVATDTNSNQIVTLFFNTQDSLLSSKSLRQALIYAIDKTSFSGERAISPLAPTSWAYNSQVKKYTYEPERAKELLETTSPDLLQEPIKIVSTPFLLPVAESIASYWQAVGVNAVVQVSSIVPSEFQVYLTIFDAPHDPDQYSVWHSTQEVSNISHFQNDRIDKLLEDGRLELDPEERKRIYLDFQRFLVEESPAAFLYHPQSVDIIRK